MLTTPIYFDKHLIITIIFSYKHFTYLLNVHKNLLYRYYYLFMIQKLSHREKLSDIKTSVKLGFKISFQAPYSQACYSTSLVCKNFEN